MSYSAGLHLCAQRFVKSTIELQCKSFISRNLIMCPLHWTMVPIIYQRPLLSHYDSSLPVEYQNDRFHSFLRRARISVICQENSCATIELLPDYLILEDTEKNALTEIVKRYRANVSQSSI